MRDNAIKQVRPTSTFESFDAYNDVLVDVVARMMKLAEFLVGMQNSLLKEKFPFSHSQMLILWGVPGVGKTHLLEALVNHIGAKSPKVLEKIFLSRSNFTHDNMIYANEYDGKPIILLDDIFSDNHSVDELHPRTDIVALMNFIRMIYEERRLVIITSNFPFKDGILPKVKDVDTVGRITSRAQEILAGSAEINLVGKDFRLERKIENRITF